MKESEKKREGIRVIQKDRDRNKQKEGKKEIKRDRMKNNESRLINHVEVKRFKSRQYHQLIKFAIKKMLLYIMQSNRNTTCYFRQLFSYLSEILLGSSISRQKLK